MTPNGGVGTARAYVVNESRTSCRQSPDSLPLFNIKYVFNGVDCRVYRRTIIYILVYTKIIYNYPFSAIIYHYILPNTV